MNKEEQEKVLMNDIFDRPIIIDEDVKKQNKDKLFPGNARLSMGKYRTDKEKKKYIEESEERELP